MWEKWIYSVLLLVLTNSSTSAVYSQVSRLMPDSMLIMLHELSKVQISEGHETGNGDSPSLSNYQVLSQHISPMEKLSWADDYNSSSDSVIMSILSAYRSRLTIPDSDIIKINAEKYVRLKKYLYIISAIFLIILTVAVLLSWFTLRNRDRQIESFSDMVDELISDKDILISDKHTLLNQIDDRMNKEDNVRNLLHNPITAIRQFIELAYEYGHDPKILHKKFHEAVKISICNTQSLDELCRIISVKHNGLISSLKIKHPKLSKNEIELCCLIAADFSNQAICILKELGDVNSVYVSKHRLKAKLELQKSPKKIKDYLLSLDSTNTPLSA